MSLADTFDGIYRANAWRGDESLSGPGSGDAATERVRTAILALVDELGVQSVLDVGCGDGYWMPDLPGYVGIDVSREAIDLAAHRHPQRRYLVGDANTIRQLTRRGMGFDLVITRDAMQHLPLLDGVRLLDAIRYIDPRYLLASTYADGANVSISPGESYTPDLTASPFLMGPAWRMIFDGYYYHRHDTDAVRDPSKFLGLWDLR